MKFLWKKNNTKNSVHAVEGNGELTYSCKVYSLSETGPTRTSNEDSILSFYPDRDQHTFFGMVADGMGGHQAGEIASGIACATASEYIPKHYNDANIKSMLGHLMQQAHTNILHAATENENYAGMGTTATMLFIRDQNIYFAHIGDSRLYYLHKQELVQCTSDNTLVHQMVQEGKITAEEATHHQMKHVLTQALGSVKEIDPELGSTGIPITNGDKFFMCSDGVYDVLQQQELASLLTLSSSLAIECIKALCMQRKASDNFSALLVEVIQGKQTDESVTKEQNIMI
jgi:protein phosphatase